MSTVLDALRLVHQSLDSVEGADMRMLTGDDLALAVRLAASAASRLDEQIVRAIPVIEELDLPRSAGTTSPTAWLSQVTGLSRGSSSRFVKASRIFGPEAEPTRQAWASGALSTEQAVVIAGAIDKLPDWFGYTECINAQQTLMEYAEQLNFDDLRRLANRIVEVIDPDGADEILARQLANQEKMAFDQTRLRFINRGNAMSRVIWDASTADVHRLQTVINAMTAPRRWKQLDDQMGHSLEGDYSELDFSHKAGLAMADLIEHLPIGELPQAGGTDAVVTVSVALDQLEQELATAMLSTGTPVSAGEARRIACNAKIIPVVLDGKSRVMDHGTAKRLHDQYQRISLAQRDGGCCWAGCDRPPSWTEAHHLEPYSRGGATSVDNGALFCPFHHRLLHQGEWSARLGDDGIVEVIPPSRIDPHQRPRRHARHTKLQPRAA